MGDSNNIKTKLKQPLVPYYYYYFRKATCALIIIIYNIYIHGCTWSLGVLLYKIIINYYLQLIIYKFACESREWFHSYR